MLGRRGGPREGGAGSCGEEPGSAGEMDSELAGLLRRSGRLRTSSKD